MTTSKKSKSKSKDDGETVSRYWQRKIQKEIEEEFCCEDWLDEHSNWRYYICGEDIY